MDTAQGFAWESGPAFVTGEAYRYNGDNWADPTVSSDIPTITDGSYFKTIDLAVPYYSRFFKGVSTPAIQATQDALLGGTAIAALPFYDGNRHRPYHFTTTTGSSSKTLHEPATGF